MPVFRFSTRKNAHALFLLLTFLILLLTSCFQGEQEKKSNQGNLSTGATAGIDSLRNWQLRISDNAGFISAIEDLDKRELQNINRIVKLFANNVADSLSRDSMLVTLNDYMISAIQGYYDTKIFGNLELNELFRTGEDHAEAQKLVQKLASHGINLYFREGEFYLEPDQNFIYSHLRGVLSSGGENYLKTRIMLANGFRDANNQPVSPADSMALRIVTWEDFIRKHPGFTIMDEIQIQYMDVLTTYLTGTEQWPLFDSSTKMLNQVYQASYIRYIENYPGRESAKIVGKFYYLLSSKGFKYDEELENFLAEVSVYSPKNPQ